MKINEASRQTAANQLRSERADINEQVDSKQQTSVSKSGTGADKVDLSAKVDRYKAASATLGNQPDFRSDRVQEIKSRIDAGTYEVSSRDVAGKMLASFARGTKH